MPRLIDAAAFCKENPSFNSEVYVALSKAPTIEAEPVVHCKDCKYSKKFKITGNRHCDFHRNFGYLVSDDDYCSFGAKMDLEDDK